MKRISFKAFLLCRRVSSVGVQKNIKIAGFARVDSRRRESSRSGYTIYVKSLTDSIVVVIVARSFDVTRSHHKQIKLKAELKTPPQQRMWRQKSPCRLLHGNSLASGTKEEKLHNCVSLDHIHEREPSTKILIEILLCFSRHSFIVVVVIIRVFFSLMRHKNKYMTELAYNISQAIIFILPSRRPRPTKLKKNMLHISAVLQSTR